MDDKFIEDFKNRSISFDAPKELFSDLTGKHFEHCTVCGKSLQESGELYMVEKVIKNNTYAAIKNTAFEFAICFSCVKGKQEGMSQESAVNLNKFFQKHLANSNLFSKFDDLDEGELKSDSFFDSCGFTNKPKIILDEYHISGQFIGDKLLIVPGMPNVVGAEVYEAMQEVLSKSTKDDLDDFMNDNLGMPPELRKLFEREVVLI